MKRIKITYTPTAANYIKHLNPVIKRQLKEIIEELMLNPYLGKPLKDEFEGYRSHRFKKYRVIYFFNEQQSKVEVLYAGSRKDIYKMFSEYLQKMKKQ